LTHKCKVYYYNMEYFSVVLGFLAVVISVLLPIILTRMTNAVIRAEDERAKQLIREMRESSERMDQRTQEMIREMRESSEKMDQRTQEMIREMRESTEKMLSRTQEMIERAQQMIREMHHDTLEVLKYLGAKIEEKV